MTALLPVDRGQGGALCRQRNGTRFFLEPEGRQTLEYYVNGVSTSMPYEVQYASSSVRFPDLEACGNHPARLRGRV